MSIPVIETIAVAILADINAITVANGFNQTLVATRLKRLMYLDEAWADLSVIVVQDDEQPGEPMVGAYNVREVSQSFSIMAIVINSDKAVAVIDTRTNQVDADIKKKLIEDTTRGGYAIDTTLMASERFTFNESFTGIIVNIEVKYRIKSDDPYTQA